MDFDRLSLTAETPKEQILQIRSYLFKLVEQLELALDSIDETNFSASFIKRLNSMQTGTVETNHVVVKTDPGIGTAVNYPDGTIILVKET